MKAKRYFLLAVILLIILGLFLTLGIINSRRVMMDVIKEEAHSFLDVIASFQENSIFAEGKYEDEVISKLINLCDYMESMGLKGINPVKLRESFDITAISVVDLKTGKVILASGNRLGPVEHPVNTGDRVSFEYFKVGSKKFIQFRYRIKGRLYQIEASAADIQLFRQEFGINKIINQMLLNPMVKYLILQDTKGIIFATPNVQKISRIEDDSTLLDAISNNEELCRITEFKDENILEVVRPFVVDNVNLGIFRMGISLDDYYRHVRATERQLILLFVVLSAIGFVLFFLFLKYESYITLKEIFHKILGSVEDGILMVDARGVITGVNNAFCMASSLDEELLLKHSYHSLFGDDFCDIAAVLENGSKAVNEKNLFGKQIQYSSYPLIDEKKRVVGVISVLRDVTKLREFEKEREEAERLKFLGNLVANFAHEIKNPLNGLSIAAQRLVKEFPSQDKEYTRLMSTLKTEIELLNRTLNDFLSLARSRAKPKEEFDLSDTFERALDVVKELVRTRGIILKENIKKDLKLLGNADDFKRAVLNILLNAVEAVAEVSDRKPEISVELFTRDQKIVLRISDNGSGMDEEEKQRIFTPYFTTKKKGTGLGLYIAQKIIREHKGEIQIESCKGQGTVFTVVFTEGGNQL